MDNNYYIRIFEKYLRDETTEAEESQLEKMLRNDVQIHSLLENGLSDADENIDATLSNRLYDNIRSSIIPKRKQLHHHLVWRKTLRWAAIFILPIATAFSAYLLTTNHFEKDPSSVTITAGKGEKAEITFSDGSQAWLNSESSISFEAKFNQKERNIFLTGEAYFEVEKDTKRPFTVKTKEMDIQVMGTSFNVNAYDDDQLSSSVILEGQVKVTAHSGGEYILGKNQRAIYNKANHILSADSVYASDFTEWKNGSLYFQNRSFEDIANTLSRVFNVDINFTSEELRSIRFSGTLGSSSIRNTLDILSLTSPMRYKMNGTTIELFLRE